MCPVQTLSAWRSRAVPAVLYRGRSLRYTVPAVHRRTLYPPYTVPRRTVIATNGHDDQGHQTAVGGYKLRTAKS